VSSKPLETSDYPLAEKRPDLVEGKRGKPLSEITLAAVLNETVTLDDLGITPRALLQQADIARAAGRPTLAQNFERSSELVGVPQETIMEIYELLRPGRANSKAQLLAAAHDLRSTYGAVKMPVFIEEAAEVYEKRGLFKKRY
jgi:propanediol dehydratase small subunit